MLYKTLIILSCILCFSSGAFKLWKGGEIDLYKLRMGIQRRNGMSCGGKRRRKSHFLPLSSPLYILCSWQLLAMPYLLLIRYEAVSSTPVMGLEMVALRSCEARDMIYPHTHTDTQRCVCLCACLTSRITSTSLTALTSHPQHIKPHNRNWKSLTKVPTRSQ